MAGIARRDDKITLHDATRLGVILRGFLALVNDQADLGFIFGFFAVGCVVHLPDEVGPGRNLACDSGREEERNVTGCFADDDAVAYAAAAGARAILVLRIPVRNDDVVDDAAIARPSFRGQ